MEYKEKSISKWSIIEKRAYQVFLNNANQVQQSDEFHLLNEKELKQIRRLKIQTISWSAFFGISGVLLLFFPQYLFPSLFPVYPYYFSIIDLQVDIPIVASVYGVVLVGLEIIGLTVINLNAVQEIARICGFPRQSDSNYKSHIHALISVGLEKQDKRSLNLGINPYLGLSRFFVIMLFLLDKAKVAISNLLFKLLVKRLFGRIALRLLMDLAGLPVYALWNALASRAVIKQGTVRVMAPPLIKRIGDIMEKNVENNTENRQLLYDTLQHIAVSKRNFHHNHYILASELIARYKIDINRQGPYLSDQEFIERISNKSREEQSAFIKLYIFGMLVDGGITRRELRILEDLNTRKLIPFKKDEIKSWEKDFVNGRGLESLFETNI